MTLNNPLISRSGLWPVLVMLASLASAKGPTDGQLFKEYMESAAKGDGEAIYSVGFCYWHGIGVAKNPVEAYAYWNLRGMSERVDARHALQVLEEEKEITPEIRARGQQRAAELQKKLDAAAGPGGPPSVKCLTHEERFAEYMALVEHGDMGYLYSVGLCYAEGLGVKKDLAEAYAYWNLRGTAGKQDIRWGLQLLGKEMSPEEKRSGRARVSVLQKEIDDKVRVYRDSHKAAR